MSILAILDLTLAAETAAAALPVLDDVLVATREFAGSEGVEVLVQSDDPTHVLVLERWASREADTAYRAWRAEQGDSPLTPFVRELAVTHYDLPGSGA
ncbi:MAG: putative quinol monooxygenase [Candidatus Nanopelagicales bacterium]